MAISIFQIDLAAMVESVQTSLKAEIAEYEQKYHFSEVGLYGTSEPKIDLNNSNQATLLRISETEESLPETSNSSVEENKDEAAIVNLSNKIISDTPNETITIAADASTKDIEDAIANEIVNVLTDPVNTNSELSKNVESVQEETNASIDKIKEEISEEIAKYLEYYKSLINQRNSNETYKQALAELSSGFRHSYQSLDIAGQNSFFSSNSINRNTSEREKNDLQRISNIEELNKELERKMNEHLGRKV